MFDLASLENNPNYTVAGDMSVTIVGDPIDCRDIQQLAFHEVWTGTPTGSFVYEGSNDPALGATTWLDVTAEVTPIFGDGNPNNAAGEQGVVIRDLFRYMRRRYVAGAGSGTLNTYASGKRV